MPEVKNDVVKTREDLFKLKLLDCNKQLLQMSSVDFEKICQNRVAKQSQDTCFEIVKVLNEALKIAELNQSKEEEIEQQSFMDFCSRLGW